MKPEILELSRKRNYMGCNPVRWTNEQINDFKMSNEQQLAKINATLRPDENLSGKIGIFLPGQNGDLITATGILNHRHSMFPGKQIIWFANAPNADALRWGPVSEVRPWPWAGNGLPAGTPDFYPLLCNTENRLNLELAKQYELTADLEDGYFPAPWMVAVENRHNVDYPNVSRKVFKLPDGLPWQPHLCFSDPERQYADNFIFNLGEGKKIFVETFVGSGQSILNEDMISGFMQKCEQHWGECKFIFASHKFLHARPEFPEGFFQQPHIFSCANFTIRQCALIAKRCHLMLSVSSGISVAVSCRQISPPPILQFCGSWICSTQSMASGPFELVTADLRSLDEAKAEFYQKLEKLLA